MYWKIIGIAAATLTMFGFLPQIGKIIKTKSARDISLVTALQLMAGVLLWILYGVHLKDIIIIVANAVTLSTLIVILILMAKYK